MKLDKRTGNSAPARTVWRIPAVAAACVFASAAAAFAGGGYATDPVRLASIDLGRGRALHIVSVDIGSGRVEIDSAGADARYGAVDSFGGLVRRSGASAAINGCFFDLNTGRLVGHIWHNGEQRVRGSFSAALAIRRDNTAVIAPMKELGDPRDYRVIIACVDILIRNGEILVKSKKDLVRNGHNPSRHNDIYRPARWSAVGLDHSGQVYLIASTGVMTLYEFTRQVRQRTAVTDLLGLDGGTSSGLFVNGAFVSVPGRLVPSVIVARPAGAGQVASRR
mgnify:CR=1 FL=1